MNVKTQTSRCMDASDPGEPWLSPSVRRRWRLAALTGWRRHQAALALLLFLPVSGVRADWAVLHHNGDTITSTVARCVLAPKTDHHRLRIQRVRLTRSGTADVTHRFAYKLTEDGAGDTETLAGCSPPGCRYVLSLEGAKAGQVYDLPGLDLLLPPGGRFYISEDSLSTMPEIRVNPVNSA